jgi:hypothetical protein
MTASLHHPLRHPLFGMLLLWALCWAQLMGLVHQYLHHHAPPSHSPSVQQVPHEAQHDAHGLEALFVLPHSEGKACPLFDQLGHADACLVASTAFVPAPLVQACPVCASGQAFAAEAAGYSARAPPLTLRLVS